MQDRFPNLIAALRAACEALPQNDTLRAHLDELTGVAAAGAFAPVLLRLVTGVEASRPELPIAL